VPHVEFDALFHGPGWTARPSFTADVDAATAASAWVADGNYSATRELVWARADTVVWLDLPRLLVEWQVVTRTARRLLLRTPLWNGNRERWRDLPRASHPIRWSWQKHGKYRRVYGARFADPAYAGKALVRLGSRRQVGDWISTLPPAAPASRSPLAGEVSTGTVFRGSDANSSP
jgi:adenylate kinase family enzyme